MGVKKKLKKYLMSYGVVSKVVLFFMLALGLQTIFSTTCYASVTQEYVKFILDCVGEDTNFNLASNQKQWLETYKNNSTNITNLTNNLNFYASTYNKPQENFNLIAFPYRSNTSNFYIVFIFSNCSAASSSVGFLDLRNASTNVMRPYNLNGSCLAIRLFFTDAYPSTSTTTTISDYYISNYGYTANTEKTVINLTSCYNYQPTQSIYFTPLSRYVQLNNGNFTYSNTLIPDEPETPDEPSGDSSTTGTITNPSGDITGNIDLRSIENSLNNIENKIPTSGDIAGVISGEVGKITDTLTSQPDISDTVITSDDIESALNFEFESDPYANFWLELTNGLKNALLGTKRTIDITFQSRSWTIDLDDFAVLPAWLKNILTPFSTVFFVWILVRWWKVILDKITSGNVDSVLKENSEERYF